jgi:hypothetical protein
LTAEETEQMKVQPDDTEEKTDLEEDDEGRSDYDGFWKSLIERYFYLLLKRAVPELYEKADKSRPPIFLDKEFQDLLNTGDPKIHKFAHSADKFAGVPLTEGDTERVLFHAEAQQSNGDGNLAERMYHYKCLIYGHYRQEPVALAISAEKRPSGERQFYEYSHYGTETVYRYNNLMLTELNDEELLSSDNPIDLVLYAAKKSAASKEELQKYNYLRTLAGILGDRGWSLEEKHDLHLFISRILCLEDRKLSEQYRKYLCQLNEEGKEVFIPFFERDYLEKTKMEARQEGRIEGKMEGRIEGMQEGRQEMAKNLLADGVPPEIIAKSSGLSVEQVRSLVH